MKIIKYDQDDIDKLIIVTSLVSGISALFAPVVIVQLTQEILHFSYDNWLFTAPRISYQLVMAAMLLIPVTGISYFISRAVLDKKESSLRPGWPLFIVSLLLIPLAGAGINHYYYINDDGLHYNHLGSLAETTFKWDEISKVQPYSVSENGRLSFYYIFMAENGERVTLTGDDDFFRHRSDIFSEIEQNGGQILERDSYEESR